MFEITERFIPRLTSYGGRAEKLMGYIYIYIYIYIYGLLLNMNMILSYMLAEWNRETNYCDRTGDAYWNQFRTFSLQQGAKSGWGIDAEISYFLRCLPEQTFEGQENLGVQTLSTRHCNEHSRLSGHIGRMIHPQIELYPNFPPSIGVGLHNFRWNLVKLYCHYSAS